MTLTTLIDLLRDRAVDFADESDMVFYWDHMETPVASRAAFVSKKALDPLIEESRNTVAEKMSELDAILYMGHFAESNRPMARWHATCFQSTIQPQFFRTYCGFSYNDYTTRVQEHMSKKPTEIVIIEWSEMQQRVLDRTKEVLNSLHGFRDSLERLYAAQQHDTLFSNNEAAKRAKLCKSPVAELQELDCLEIEEDATTPTIDLFSMCRGVQTPILS